MAQDFGELAAYVTAHKSDPLTTAKVIVAWAWTSLLPGGYGQEPTSGPSVPAVMNASCGWRDILLEDLFTKIGVEHRRVNFADVPFQLNHTATELKIGGKWMFFDATFGIYLERKGGGAPLSIEEARNLWPDVVAKQCSLPGWQGKFIDPDAISASAYKTMSNTFAFQPQPFATRTDVVSGELNSLYFGPKATYLDNGWTTTVPTPQHTWKTYTDTAARESWKKIVDSFDSSGRLDTRNGVLDNKCRWFVDYDQKQKFGWMEKWAYTNGSSILDYSVTIYDDRSKTVVDNDDQQGQIWKTLSNHYNPGGKVDHWSVVYDDGSFQLAEFDLIGSFEWNSHVDAYDASGLVQSSTVTYHDDTTETINWSTAARQNGTSDGDGLYGTAGRDLLRGLEGNDVLSGGPGQDRLEGGLGDDAYFIDASDFAMERPDEGVDTVISAVNYVLGPNLEKLVLSGGIIYGSGNELANTIVGNSGANVLSGYAGDDRLRGIEGNDFVTGGAGKDTVEGGVGADTLWGGSGGDTFLWRDLAELGASKADADLVRDFSRAAGDILNLKLIDADATKLGNQAFTFIGNAGFSAAAQIRFAQDSIETRLFFNTDADAAAEAVVRLYGKLTPEKSWFVL